MSLQVAWVFKGTCGQVAGFPSFQRMNLNFYNVFWKHLIDSTFKQEIGVNKCHRLDLAKYR